MSYSMTRSLGAMVCPDGTVEKYDDWGNAYCVDEVDADKVNYPEGTGIHCQGLTVPLVDVNGDVECVCPLNYQLVDGECVLNVGGDGVDPTPTPDPGPGSGGGSGGGSTKLPVVVPTPAVSKASLPDGIAIMIGAGIGIAALALLV